MAIFFTSDTHFNHANIIRYCSRPFGSVGEMNEVLIANWNGVVGPEDTVYHLGDFAMGPSGLWERFVSRLNGKKILILGSHDRSLRRWAGLGFVEAHKELMWEGWLLRHEPLYDDRKMLCGHVHNHWAVRGQAINVGVDVRGFTPRTIEELTGP